MGISMSRYTAVNSGDLGGWNTHRPPSGTSTVERSPVSRSSQKAARTGILHDSLPSNNNRTNKDSDTSRTTDFVQGKQRSSRPSIEASSERKLSLTVRVSDECFEILRFSNDSNLERIAHKLLDKFHLKSLYARSIMKEMRSMIERKQQAASIDIADLSID